MWQKLFRYRYLIGVVLFGLWMIFFDQNNLIDQMKLSSQLQDLKREKAYYEEEKEKAIKEYDELFTNEESLEKFAREKYLMKRDNEDIFVIVQE